MGILKIFFNNKLQKFFKWPSQFQSSPLSGGAPALDYAILFSPDNLTNVPAASSPFLSPYNIDLVLLKQEFSTISKWMQ